MRAGLSACLQHHATQLSRSLHLITNENSSYARVSLLLAVRLCFIVFYWGACARIMLSNSYRKRDDAALRAKKDKYSLQPEWMHPLNAQRQQAATSARERPQAAVMRTDAMRAPHPTPTGFYAPPVVVAVAGVVQLSTATMTIFQRRRRRCRRCRGCCRSPM